jgi:small subunit ribosomal protein S17
MSLNKQEFIAEVVSVKMQKTIVVSVKSTKVHPKYKKRYTTAKKYMAHFDLEKNIEVGNKVRIQSCRPMSKNKKWVVLDILNES